MALRDDIDPRRQYRIPKTRRDDVLPGEEAQRGDAPAYKPPKLLSILTKGDGWRRAYRGVAASEWWPRLVEDLRLRVPMDVRIPSGWQNVLELLLRRCASVPTWDRCVTRLDVVDRRLVVGTSAAGAPPEVQAAIAAAQRQCYGTCMRCGDTVDVRTTFRGRRRRARIETTCEHCAEALALEDPEGDALAGL